MVDARNSDTTLATMPYNRNVGRLSSSGASRRTRKQPTLETARQTAAYSPGEWVGFGSSRVHRARYDRDNQLLENSGIPPFSSTRRAAHEAALADARRVLGESGDTE